MTRNDINAARNPECTWFEAKTEAFFAEDLAGQERQRAQSHVAECAACRQEVESLRAIDPAIDPLMKDVLRYRTVLAGRPVRRRLHVVRVFAAAATAACAAVLAVALLTPGKAGPGTQIAHVQAPQPTPIDQTGPGKVEKEHPTVGNDEEKPGEPRATTVPGASNNNLTGPRPTFAVSNVALQERTLADFRGQPFLFGVLTPSHPQAAANLERIYRAFGTRIRLVAIAKNRTDRAPKDTTFQMLYNSRNSELLGAHESDFVLLDGNGAELSRGSLLGDPAALVKRVGATLDTTKPGSKE